MDRFFTSYFLHCDLQAKGVDFVVRIKESCGKHYLTNTESDKTVEIQRKAKGWAGERETLLSYPKVKRFRTIKHISKKEGFRDKVFYFLTSLSDEYSAKEIIELYDQRWDVELNFRSLKRTLGCYFLKSKSPSMVQKEIYFYILSYNLVRAFMSQSANPGRAMPRKLSFKTALLLLLESLRIKKRKVRLILQEILSKEILNSPFRIEPRKFKKRHRGSLGYLMVPRLEFKRLHVAP
jgi:hypothetical protein